MKTSLFIFLCLFFSGFSSPAAVTLTATGVFVEGAIEGDGFSLGVDGDTIDYLTFEVTTTGPVRLIGTGLRSSQFLAMGQDVGGGEPFDIVGIPYLLFRTTNQTHPEFSHILNPGIYLVQIGALDDEDSDLYPYFTPVNRSGGGFGIPYPYSFTLEGQFQALDFMEGNLNGTFTVTPVVPEPSAAALLGAVAAALGFTRRRRT
jgi:hypothetical protein